MLTDIHAMYRYLDIYIYTYTCRVNVRGSNVSVGPEDFAMVRELVEATDEVRSPVPESICVQKATRFR